MSTNGLGDRIAALVLLALAMFVIIDGSSFPAPVQPLDPGIAAFPQMTAGLLGALALVLLLRPEDGEPLPRGVPAVRLLGTVTLLLIYALTLDVVGFVISTTFFLLATLLLIGVRRTVVVALISVGVSLGLFYLFRVVLGVSLPTSGLGGLPI